MTTATGGQRFLTSGEAARRLGVPEWTVGRMFSRGLVPEPPRLARARVISEESLPELRDALERAGYLRAEAEPTE